jgi:hypothetical protein
MMTECTSGLQIPQARQLIDEMQQWFGSGDDATPPNASFTALGSIRQHPAQKISVLLA